MLHSGQICMSTERVIVQRGAVEALKSAIAALCEKLKAGDPTDSASQLSGLFSAGSADNVLSLFQEAKDAGADVILGDLKKNGTVIQPHLFSGMKPGMRLWDRESFGPGKPDPPNPFSLSIKFTYFSVIAFAEVDTVDEAVELANSTDYSLVASLWTRDVNSAFDVAGRIRAGKTRLNRLQQSSLRALGPGIKVALMSTEQLFTRSLQPPWVVSGTYSLCMISTYINNRWMPVAPPDMGASTLPTSQTSERSLSIRLTGNIHLLDE
jgi:acyl-CoA reductase-like NAD-dependent aldehyde dehydrogenase